MTAEPQPECLTWKVEILERVRDEQGRWRMAGVAQGDLDYAMASARQLRDHNGAARLTAPGFEVVARRDYFAVKRTEVAA